MRVVIYPWYNYLTRQHCGTYARGGSGLSFYYWAIQAFRHHRHFTIIFPWSLKRIFLHYSAFYRNVWILICNQQYLIIWLRKKDVLEWLFGVLDITRFNLTAPFFKNFPGETCPLEDSCFAFGVRFAYLPCSTLLRVTISYKYPPSALVNNNF